MYPPQVWLQVRFTFLRDLWVRLTFGQMYPHRGEVLGQVDIFQIFGSGWPFVRCTPPTVRLQIRLTCLSVLQVRLTFGQMYPHSLSEASGHVDIFSDLKCQADLWSDVPYGQRHLVSKFYTTACLCQAHLWSDVSPSSEASGQADVFVRSLDQADLWSDIAPISEASGQVDMFVRSSGQADLWSDVPPPPQWGFRSGWHFCEIFRSGWPLVRCTPLAETSCGQVLHYCTFVSGWPLVRCTPTMGRDILWPSVILLQVRLTSLFEGKSGVSSNSNSSSMSRY